MIREQEQSDFRFKHTETRMAPHVLSISGIPLENTQTMEKRIFREKECAVSVSAILILNPADRSICLLFLRIWRMAYDDRKNIFTVFDEL